VKLSIAGLPPGAGRVLVRHYRIDRDHSNAYAAWKAMGSPQNPAPGQYATLQAAGQLQLLDSPGWVTSKNHSLEMEFTLPRQAVSLLEFSW